MPEFSTPFRGNNSDKKLTKDELIRAIRFSIASEFEAIQLYEQLKESISDIECKKLLDEIAGDEKTHVGNFLYILEKLSPDDKKHISDGKQEASEIIRE